MDGRPTQQASRIRIIASQRNESAALASVLLLSCSRTAFLSLSRSDVFNFYYYSPHVSLFTEVSKSSHEYTRLGKCKMITVTGTHTYLPTYLPT